MTKTVPGITIAGQRRTGQTCALVQSAFGISQQAAYNPPNYTVAACTSSAPRFSIGNMSDRPENNPNEPRENYSGKMEWLYDTMDQTPPKAGKRPRRGFPCGTLILLFVGVAVIAAVLWMLIGPPLRANEMPTPTATATATLAMPTPLPSATPRLIPSPTASPAATAESAFAVGDRVVISGTSSQGVRIRAGAGVDFLTQGIYYDGDAFFVLPNSDPQASYPVENDGYVWWRLRAADGLIGWTVEEFLDRAPLLVETPTPAS